MIEIFHVLKFQEFINELGTTFSIGETEMNPLEILSIPQNVCPKGAKDKCF